MNLNNIEFGMGATFRGRRSPALAWSCLVRTEDVKGRRISLDVAIDDGRIEDVLKIAQPLFRRRGAGPAYLFGFLAHEKTRNSGSMSVVRSAPVDANCSVDI